MKVTLTLKVFTIWLFLLLLVACALFPTPTPPPPADATREGSVGALPDLTLYAQVAMDGYAGGCVVEYTPLVTQLCVENRGAGPAGAFVIRAEKGQGEWPVTALEPQATHCFQVDANLAAVMLAVDPDDALAEADETNNTWRAPIPTPPLLCTSTAAPPPPATSTLAPTPPTKVLATTAPEATAPQPSLAITSFTLDMADLPEGGKRITFNWTTTGATHVALYTGVQMRFPIWWDNQPANGSLTHDFLSTNYPNPKMTLTAVGADGAQVSRDIIPEWPCPYPYFFATPPNACASLPASHSAAAEQFFEHGRMIWLQEMTESLGEEPTGGYIFVFRDDGSFARYDDTWIAGQPESDPALIPPEGLQQPIRGFGKLWRENSDIQAALGWALSAEMGYTGAWQPQRVENIPSLAYIQTASGGVLRTVGSWHEGDWEVWP